MKILIGTMIEILVIPTMFVIFQTFQKKVKKSGKSVDYTKELLTYGSATYIEVLNAQTSLLSAQLNSVNDRLQQLDAMVTLYRALGGGWK